MLRLGECHGELAWGVAQTRPGKEPLATSEIVAAGLSCFWPHYVKTATNRGKVQRYPVSLFPGYVFFGFPPGSWIWRTVRRCPGVAWVLQSGIEAPALVPMGFLRELVGHEAELAHNLARARVAVGMQVRIKDRDNPFFGLWAKLTKLDADGRIEVMLNILGGLTPIDGLTVDQIEAAE